MKTISLTALAIAACLILAQLLGDNAALSQRLDSLSSGRDWRRLRPGSSGRRRPIKRLGKPRLTHPSPRNMRLQPRLHKLSSR